MENKKQGKKKEKRIELFEQEDNRKVTNFDSSLKYFRRKSHWFKMFAEENKRKDVFGIKE